MPLLSVPERSKIFQKMGFWEADLKSVTVSCGKCNKAVFIAMCKEVESVVVGSRIFTKRLQFFCPHCDNVVIGADI